MKKVVAIYRSAKYSILVLKNVSMSVLVFSNYVTLSLCFNIVCNQAEVARDKDWHQAVIWGNIASRFFRSSQGDLRGDLSSPVNC